MYKKVFIIGNGFDLNLGWETSYRDFVKSDLWPIRKKGINCPMAEFLNQNVGIDNWYDLEDILKEYASDKSIRPIADPRDEVFFIELKNALTLYIKQEEEKDIKTDSLAVKVLEAIVENGYFNDIYTFNYTDLCKIAEKAGIPFPFHYESVHGSVARNSIILGVDSYTDLCKGYDYLRKTFSKHYSSHHIRYALQECDEVVFFGHSLGEMDYAYFADFFNDQSRCKKRQDGKRITIFTKDDHSRIQILKQLRLMNEGQIERLQNDNGFMFIMTEAPDPFLLKKFFEHLDKESKSTNERTLDSFAALL